MDLITIIFAVIAVLNGIAAVSVGFSKFRWSKVIRETKDAQIEGLKTAKIYEMFH